MGEEGRKKGSGNLFSSEPTDKAWNAEETLDPGSMGLLGRNQKRLKVYLESFDFLRKMGLEPTRSQ